MSNPNACVKCERPTTTIEAPGVGPVSRCTVCDEADGALPGGTPPDMMDFDAWMSRGPARMRDWTDEGRGMFARLVIAASHAGVIRCPKCQTTDVDNLGDGVTALCMAVECKHEFTPGASPSVGDPVQSGDPSCLDCGGSGHILVESGVIDPHTGASEPPSAEPCACAGDRDAKPDNDLAAVLGAVSRGEAPPDDMRDTLVDHSLATATDVSGGLPEATGPAWMWELTTIGEFVLASTGRSLHTTCPGCTKEWQETDDSAPLCPDCVDAIRAYQNPRAANAHRDVKPDNGDSSEPPSWATVHSGIADRGRVSLELVPGALLWFDGLPDALATGWAIDAAVRASTGTPSLTDEALKWKETACSAAGLVGIDVAHCESEDTQRAHVIHVADLRGMELADRREQVQSLSDDVARWKYRALNAEAQAPREAAGGVALPRPPGPEHGDSGDPLEPTDSEARAYAEILLRWAAAHTGDHAPRVLRALELLTEAPREADPVELGRACYNAYQDDQGNTEFAHAWRELTVGQRMNWEAAALAVRDLVVARAPREAPCPDTGHPCNQSCTVRCAKTGGDRAPREADEQHAVEAGLRVDLERMEEAWRSEKNRADTFDGEMKRLRAELDSTRIERGRARVRAQNAEARAPRVGEAPLELAYGVVNAGLQGRVPMASVSALASELIRLGETAGQGDPMDDNPPTSLYEFAQRGGTLGATPPAESPEQPEGYSFRRGPDSVVVERFNENGEAVAMFLVQPNDGPFKTTHIKIEGDRAAYDFAMGLLARTKGASAPAEPDTSHDDLIAQFYPHAGDRPSVDPPVGQPYDAQRYREALRHIANGGLSPCLSFAQLILAGHTLLDAHRADCARADRGEYTLPDPPPFAPDAPKDGDQ